MELVGSPTISITNKDTFTFLLGGNPENTAFTMTPENIFYTAHPIIEYHYEYLTRKGKQQCRRYHSRNNNNQKISSQIKLLYRNPSATTKREYYGTLGLLASQAIFDNVLGKNTHMFVAQPNNLNNTKNKEYTRNT